jgi:hypothetical protein
MGHQRPTRMPARVTAMGRLRRFRRLIRMVWTVGSGHAQVFVKIKSSGTCDGLGNGCYVINPSSGRVTQPAVEVAVLRALRLLPSNVAGECALSGPIKS